MTPAKQSLILIALCACAPIAPEIRSNTGESAFETFDTLPADADPQSCWAALPGKETRDTIDRFIEVSPARTNATGQEISPPVFRKIEEERITRAPDQVFEQVCQSDLTPRFVGTLQRALIARGLLDQTATERLDDATRVAITTYQSDRGISSDTLSIAMARELGLVAIVLPSPK